MSRKNAAQEGKERAAAAEEEAATHGRRGEGGGLRGRYGERGCPRMALSARARQKSKGVLALAVNPLVKRHFSLLKDAIAFTR